MSKYKLTMAVLAMTLATCVHAEAAGMNLKTLEGMLSGLGLTTKADKDGITISNQAKSDSDVLISLNEDNTVMSVEASFEAIPPEKQALIPYAAILKANADADWMRLTFGIRETPDTKWLSLAGNFDARTLTPKSLRAILDDVVTTIDADDPLWNQEKWAAATPNVDAAKAAYVVAWEASPLRVTNATFINPIAPNSGGYYEKRASNIFKPGEKVIAHFEPQYYAWKKEDDGGFTFGVRIDFALLNAQGEVVVEKLNGLGESSYRSHERQMEFSTDATLSFDSLAVGDYSVRYTFHDMYGPKTVSVTLPFKIQS
jgi:hypothetical protein